MAAECLVVGAAGELKHVAQDEHHRWQLLPNMGKAGADLAYKAVKAGKIFHSHNVWLACEH
jgi:hypothetical protein